MAEIDILRVLLAFQPWRKQADHMHVRETAVSRHLPNIRLFPLLCRQPGGELCNDVAQMVKLRLLFDVIGGAA